MVLTIGQAHLFSLLFASIYVGSIYVSKHARISFSSKNAAYLGRNDPSVIKARLAAVTIATFLSITTVFLIFKDEAPRLLGLSSIGSLKVHLTTPLLFLGPIYQYLSFFSGVDLDGLKELFLSWVGLRNYLLAPISEELVFRSCVLAVYLAVDSGRASSSSIALWSPLSFGLAHIHHGYEQYNQMGKTRRALQNALASSLFQFLYTTLFGIHAAFLYLRSGSVFPSISAHIFCNYMGLPPVNGRVLRQKDVMFAYLMGIGLYIYAMRQWSLSPSTLWK